MEKIPVVDVLFWDLIPSQEINNDDVVNDDVDDVNDDDGNQDESSVSTPVDKDSISEDTKSTSTPEVVSTTPERSDSSAAELNGVESVHETTNEKPLLIPLLRRRKDNPRNLLALMAEAGAPSTKDNSTNRTQVKFAAATSPGSDGENANYADVETGSPKKQPQREGSGIGGGSSAASQTSEDNNQDPHSRYDQNSFLRKSVGQRNQKRYENWMKRNVVGAESEADIGRARSDPRLPVEVKHESNNLTASRVHNRYSGLEQHSPQFLHVSSSISMSSSTSNNSNNSAATPIRNTSPTSAQGGRFGWKSVFNSSMNVSSAVTAASPTRSRRKSLVPGINHTSHVIAKSMDNQLVSVATDPGMATPSSSTAATLSPNPLRQSRRKTVSGGRAESFVDAPHSSSPRRHKWGVSSLFSRNNRSRDLLQVQSSLGPRVGSEDSAHTRHSRRRYSNAALPDISNNCGLQSEAVLQKLVGTVQDEAALASKNNTDVSRTINVRGASVRSTIRELLILGSLNDGEGLPPIQGKLRVLLTTEGHRRWKTYFCVLTRCLFLWFQSEQHFSRGGLRNSSGCRNFVLQRSIVDVNKRTDGRFAIVCGDYENFHIRLETISHASAQAEKQHRASWVVSVLSHIRKASTIQSQLEGAAWMDVDRQIAQDLERGTLDPILMEYSEQI